MKRRLSALQFSRINIRKDNQESILLNLFTCYEIVNMLHTDILYLKNTLSVSKIIGRSFDFEMELKKLPNPEINL